MCDFNFKLPKVEGAEGRSHAGSEVCLVHRGGVMQSKIVSQPTSSPHFLDNKSFKHMTHSRNSDCSNNVHAYCWIANNKCTNDHKQLSIWNSQIYVKHVAMLYMLPEAKKFYSPENMIKFDLGKSAVNERRTWEAH